MQKNVTEKYDNIQNQNAQYTVIENPRNIHMFHNQNPIKFFQQAGYYTCD